MLGWFSAATARASRSNRSRRSGSAAMRVRQHLQRDLAAQLRVFGEEDLAHAAGADGADDPVVAERGREQAPSVPRTANGSSRTSATSLGAYLRPIERLNWDSHSGRGSTPARRSCRGPVMMLTFTIPPGEPHDRHAFLYAHQEHHLGQTAGASRLRGVRPHRRQMGAPAHVPDLRAYPLLRLVAEPPRVQARARGQPSRDRVRRTRRALALLLPRRRLRRVPTRSPWNHIEGAATCKTIAPLCPPIRRNSAARCFPSSRRHRSARIEAIGHRRTYAAGELLIEQGQQITQFFLVIEGARRHRAPDIRRRRAHRGPWARASSLASCTRCRAGAAW